MLVISNYKLFTLARKCTVRASQTASFEHILSNVVSTCSDEPGQADVGLNHGHHGFITDNHTSPLGYALRIGCLSVINPWSRGLTITYLVSEATARIYEP